MSYKPLSQTVTDGQKNPISSDAVHDHVASEIAAIPSGANDTLSNLSSPTAVNQNLNMGTKELKFNSNTRQGHITGELPPTSTGINVTVPNAGDIGFIIVNGNPQYLTYFKVGDIVSLSGLAPKVTVTSISPSGNNLIVFTSPNIGAGGGGISREVLLERPLFSFDSGNTILFGVSRNRELLTSGSYFAWRNAPNLSPPASGIFIGMGGNGNGSVAVGVGGTVNGSNNFCFGGFVTTLTGTQNLIIARGAKITSGSYNVILGDAAQSVNTLTGNENTSIGCGAGYNITSGAYNVILGSSGFDSSSQAITTGSRNTLLGAYTQAGASTNAGIALGFGAKTESNTLAIGSLSYPINNVFLGAGAAEHTNSENLKPVTIQYAKVSGSNVSSHSAELYLAGSQATGTGVSGGVILQTADVGNSGSSLNVLKDRLRIESDGKIGVHLYPSSEFHIKSEINTQGNLLISQIGKGLQIAEGDNATIGVTTLAAGTATVNTTAVKSNSRIMLTNQNPGGTVGFLHVSARTANTSFVITSSEAADTSDVAWMIVNPIEIDADAQAFITAAGTLTTIEKLAVSDLVKGMKTAGVWSKVKAVYPFVGGTSTTCKFNLKDPQDTDGAYRMVFSGSPTFTGGFRASSNTTATTKLKFNDFTGSQDLHALYYSNESGGKDLYEVGSYVGNTTTGQFMIAAKTTSYASGFFRIFGPSNTSVQSTDAANGSGIVGYSSTATNQYSIWSDSKLKFKIISHAAAANVALTANEVLVGIPFTQSGGDVARPIGFLSLGDGLTKIELINYAKLIETFVSTLDRQVFV